MSECNLFFKMNGKIIIPKDFKLGQFRNVKCMLNHKRLFGTLTLNTSNKYFKSNKSNNVKLKIMNKLKKHNILYLTQPNKNDRIYYFFHKSNIINVIKYIYIFDLIQKSRDDYIPRLFYLYYLFNSNKYTSNVIHNFFYEIYIMKYIPIIEKQFDISILSLHTYENLYTFLKKNTKIIDDYYNIVIPTSIKYIKSQEKIYNKELKSYIKTLPLHKKKVNITIYNVNIKDTSDINIKKFL